MQEKDKSGKSGQGDKPRAGGSGGKSDLDKDKKSGTGPQSGQGLSGQGQSAPSRQSGGMGGKPGSGVSGEIGLPKDVPATPPDDKAGEPKQAPQM